jgi:hypothetical protein
MHQRLTRLVAGSTVSFLLAAAAIVSLAPASEAAVQTVPITCDVPGTSGVSATARIKIVAPAFVRSGHAYNASFRTAITDLSPTPIGVYGFSITPNYTITGPTSPNGALSFTQPPVDYPAAGSTVSFTTFTQAFTPSGPAGGVITYALSSIDYVFSLSAGGPPVPVHCTLDGGPIIVTQSTVQVFPPFFGKPAITLTPWRVGVEGKHLFRATGAPLPGYKVTAGDLPPGVQLGGDGLLSGTPTKPGTYTFTVTASNGVDPDATKVVTLPVYKALPQ